MTFGTFFPPGPTDVRPEILAAMLQPMIPHRSDAFESMFARAQTGLRQVFDTERPVYVSASSATGMMEAGVRCAPEGAVLSLVNGAFSERFANIAVACGRKVDRYEIPWGEAHDPARLTELLRAGQYAVITVVHSETSTGVLNDVRAISDAAHADGVCCIIDSVSGIGGAELHFDAGGFDYVLTGSQKAMALPPGLAFAAAAPSFIERARSTSNRGVYFDLVELDTFARQSQTPATPSVSLFYALDRQLTDIAREGMPARWARHCTMAACMVQWVEDAPRDLGVELRVMAPEGYRAPTVTTVLLPEWLRSDTLIKAVAKRGFTLASGYGKLAPVSIRVGHMGDHTVETLSACLAACSDALREIASAR
jgi:aspartate aminotransferase-like enzyme